MSQFFRVELDSGEVQDIPIVRERSLAEVLGDHGLPLNTRCGKRGLCKGCEVRLTEGGLLMDGDEINSPAAVHACRAHLKGPVTIQIPARSRIEHRPQVGESFEIAVPYAHQPLFPFASGIKDTAFAVDVGTTTVVVLLVDLVSGEVLSRAGALNAQIRYGDNVVTRIEAAHKLENLAGMQRAIVMETIQPLLLRACERAGRSLERIAGGAIAGNTTMLHLLMAEDPTPLGVAPFTPRFIEGKSVLARDIHLAGLSPEIPIQLLPGISAYIGADITAGVFVSGMVYDSSPSLLVDIGTNGEMVLQSDGKLFGCATAAGPAFEGCGLSCGMRARDGAVSGVKIGLNPFQLETEMIGKVSLGRAAGLCGSAYIDFLATGRSCGLIGYSGRFENTAWENLPPQNRFGENGQRALRLSETDGTGTVRISELDIALLLQAKAAIGAGIEILLESAGIRAADLGRVYLAGGFGMHLNVASAIAIGLLPGIREDQVRVVGNTALAGALLSIIDRNTLQEMESIRAQVEVIELNLFDGFEDRYVEHLMLP